MLITVRRLDPRVQAADASEDPLADDIMRVSALWPAVEEPRLLASAQLCPTVRRTVRGLLRPQSSARSAAQWQPPVPISPLSAPLQIDPPRLHLAWPAMRSPCPPEPLGSTSGWATVLAHYLEPLVWEESGAHLDPFLTSPRRGRGAMKMASPQAIADGASLTRTTGPWYTVEWRRIAVRIEQDLRDTSIDPLDVLRRLPWAHDCRSQRQPGPGKRSHHPSDSAAHVEGVCLSGSPDRGPVPVRLISPGWSLTCWKSSSSNLETTVQ
jgi:hypothetical protein